MHIHHAGLKIATYLFIFPYQMSVFNLNSKPSAKRANRADLVNKFSNALTKILAFVATICLSRLRKRYRRERERLTLVQPGMLTHFGFHLIVFIAFFVEIRMKDC